MRDINQIIKEKWAIIIAVLFVCVGLGLLLWAVLFSYYKKPENVNSQKYWEYGSRFSDKDFLFLEENEWARLGQNKESPFLSKKIQEKIAGELQKEQLQNAQKHDKQKRIAPQKKKTIAVSEKQPLKTKAAAAEKNQNISSKIVKPAESAPPKYRAEVRVAWYVFYRQNQSGKAVAIVRMKNKAGDVTVYTFSVGEKKEGITILGMSEHMLKIRDASGRTRQLELNTPVGLVTAVRL